MKKNIPFYSNTPDDVHCFQANLRMILEYFLPNKEFSWSKLEKMTNYHKNLWTWPMAGLISLKKMGFDVTDMEDFDYIRFVSKREKYVLERFGKEVGTEQLKNSDIHSEIENAKHFVKLFGNQVTIPSIRDIEQLISKGYLVVCNVNLKILNNEKGYVGHFVLLFDFDKKNFYLHDPGLPARKNRKVPIKLFNKAWAYPTKRERSLIAFKYLPKRP